MFAARKRRWIAAGLVPLGVSLGACSSPTEEDHEPEVATIVLTVGAQTVEVDAETGAVAGGPIAISANTAISAGFFKADGSPETTVTGAEFRFDVESDDTAVVSFTRTGAFAGTLVRVGAGGTVIRISLFHLEEMHEEFGPHPVAIAVS